MVDPTKDDLKSKHLIPLQLSALLGVENLINSINKITKRAKVDKSELYALCKCGSGKKYKFCCYKR